MVTLVLVPNRHLTQYTALQLQCNHIPKGAWLGVQYWAWLGVQYWAWLGVQYWAWLGVQYWAWLGVQYWAWLGVQYKCKKKTWMQRSQPIGASHAIRPSHCPWPGRHVRARESGRLL